VPPTRWNNSGIFVNELGKLCYMFLMTPNAKMFVPFMVVAVMESYGSSVICILFKFCMVNHWLFENVLRIYFYLGCDIFQYSMVKHEIFILSCWDPSFLFLVDFKAIIIIKLNIITLKSCFGVNIESIANAGEKKHDPSNCN